VSLCQAEACQSMGAEALAAHARRRLGIDFHETSANGRFSLEPIYCLGNCACSPAIMIDGRLYGRVTPQRFDELVADRAPSP
jgi:formate dehydrogenase subunit gamma